MAMPDVVRSVCEKNAWTRKGNQVEVPIPGDRAQTIFVDSFSSAGEEMVRIYSRVGDASALSETRLLAALGINFKLPHGALATHEGHLVMCDTFLIRQADADEVEHAMQYLAATSDRYELQIYGTDQH